MTESASGAPEPVLSDDPGLAPHQTASLAGVIAGMLAIEEPQTCAGRRAPAPFSSGAGSARVRTVADAIVRTLLDNPSPANRTAGGFTLDDREQVADKSLIALYYENA